MARLLALLGTASGVSGFGSQMMRSGLRTSAIRMAAVGDKFPAVSVDFGFPPTKVDMRARLAGKKTIIVGLPGAFTPT